MQGDVKFCKCGLLVLELLSPWRTIMWFITPQVKLRQEQQLKVSKHQNITCVQFLIYCLLPITYCLLPIIYWAGMKRSLVFNSKYCLLPTYCILPIEPASKHQHLTNHLCSILYLLQNETIRENDSQFIFLSPGEIFHASTSRPAGDFYNGRAGGVRGQLWWRWD